MNLSMRSVTVFAALGAAIFSQSAAAKPILWFHFNEKAPGQACAPGDQTIINAVGGASDLDGAAKALKWDSTATDDSGAHYVSYTNALDEATTWIDPATGEKGDTRGAYIHIKGEEAGATASGGDNAGVIVVPDNEKLHLNHFTVEFFMKKDVVKYPSEVLPIQLYNSAGNTFAWQIRFGACSAPFDDLGKAHEIKFNASKLDGTSLFSKAYNPRYDINDGKWHHIAMTYDGTTCSIYCDYLLLGSVTATLEYAANPADAVLAIGNSPRSTWGRYHGWIDEVRLSDEVLAPKDFLRSIPVLCDKDTLVYVPFDRIEAGRGDFGYFGMTNNLNEVFPLTATSFPLDDTSAGAIRTYVGSSQSGVWPTLTNDVPLAAVRSGFFATNAVANGNALAVPANGPYVTVLDTANTAYHNILTNDAYTYEYFFKPKSDSNAYRLFGMHSTEGSTHYTTYLRYFGAAGNLCIQVATTNRTADGKIAYVGEQDTAFATVSKGVWHHLAFVGDVKRRWVSLYLDYKPILTFTNTVVRQEKHVGSYGFGFWVGGAWGGGSFAGEIDELRITRRALTPREFLANHGESELKTVNGKRVLFYAPFDEDLKAYPFKDTFGTATTGGTVTLNAEDLPGLPGGTPPIRETMGLASATEKSARGESGKITYTNPICLQGLRSFTIEWYGRFVNPHTSLPMLRFEGTLPGTSANQLGGRSDGQVYWQIAGGGAAPDYLYLSVLRDCGAQGTIYWPAPQYRRNSWHHFALTAEKTVIDGIDKLACHLYVDHKECIRQNGDVPTIYSMDYPMANGSLRLGSASWVGYTGGMDEVRITEGVLTEDEMLPAANRGMMIYIR